MGADAGLQGALGDDVAYLVHGHTEGRLQHSAAQIGALLHDPVKHGVLAEQKVSRHLGRPFTGGLDRAMLRDPNRRNDAGMSRFVPRANRAGAAL